MKSYLLIIFSIFFLCACSTTKVDKSITQSNIQDVSELILKLAQKEKELSDTIKKLEECQSSKK